MAWRDQLRPASFRGVPFFVERVDEEHGRRYAEHQYPGRDEPFLEDMGRTARARSIDAYVLEPDHIAKAKALADACDQPGPGTLVHPWLGEMRVVCTGCRQTFDAPSAGMARFDLSFAEAGSARYPDVSRNAVSSVDLGALELNDAAVAEFTSKFDVRGPDFLSASASSVLAQLGGAIGDTLGDSITAPEGIAASWFRGVSSIVSDSVSLVRSPSSVAQKILAGMDLGGLTGDISLGQNLFDNLISAAGLFSGQQTVPTWRAFIPLAAWSPNFSAFEGDTASNLRVSSARAREATNATAIRDLSRRAATAQAARAAVRETFETRDDAIAARDFIADRLDQDSQTASDGVFRAAMQLRSTVVTSINQMAPSLPMTVEYVPQAAVPALSLANGIYGDDATAIVDRSAEIVGRNRIRHPLFVPGGSALKLRTL